MPLISIPATGLKLVDDSSKAPSPPVQVMRLDLTRDMLEEILKTAASKHQKIQIHFGRIVVSLSTMPTMELTANPHERPFITAVNHISSWSRQKPVQLTSTALFPPARPK